MEDNYFLACFPRNVPKQNDLLFLVFSLPKILLSEINYLIHFSRCGHFRATLEHRFNWRVIHQRSLRVWSSNRHCVGLWQRNTAGSRPQDRSTCGSSATSLWKSLPSHTYEHTGTRSPSWMSSVGTHLAALNIWTIRLVLIGDFLREELKWIISQKSISSASFLLEYKNPMGAPTWQHLYRHLILLFPCLLFT